ncbi:hypothetical protein GQR58_012115 [Nymphon striatum]|nr:hypothetical protein GQR58_012115 [Nymphon striatum]
MWPRSHRGNRLSGRDDVALAATAGAAPAPSDRPHPTPLGHPQWDLGNSPDHRQLTTHRPSAKSATKSESSILNGAGARRERDTDFPATPLANAAWICLSLDIPQHAVSWGLPQLTTYFKFGSLLTVTPPMWSITSPPRRQSTPRFPNSGITSTGMPKQWSSSAMTTRQSLPFREILPSAVNNGRPGLSRPAMPSTTRELMIVRSLPVSTRHEKQRPLSLAGTTGIRLLAECPVAPSSDTTVPLTTPLFEGPSATLRVTPRPSGRTRRPDSNLPDENPPPQGGAQQPPLLPCEGSPGQNAQVAHTRSKRPGLLPCPKVSARTSPLARAKPSLASCHGDTPSQDVAPRT